MTASPSARGSLSGSLADRPLQLLETVVVYTPLGIRFWDPARDLPIADGLRVRARPYAAAGRRTPAFRTLSGVYAFQGLPGLQEVEQPASGRPPAASPPSARRFIVEVDDLSARFLSVAFDLDLPLPYRGLYQVDATSSPPPGAPPRFYLFSAPTRRAPAELAVVRGQLVERASGRPAAHAVVAVAAPGERTWYGLADERGRFAVLFPYPTFAVTLQTSPPAAFPRPLAEQQWPVSVSVRYAPAAVKALPGTPTPELRSLFGQGAARVWPDEAGPSADQLALQLALGAELVVRTAFRSELLIGP